MSSSLVRSSARIRRTSPSLPSGADPHPHPSPALPFCAEGFLQGNPSSCFSESAIWNPRSWSYCIHLFLELLSFVETFMSWKDHPVTWPQRDLKRRDVFPPEFKQNKFCTYMGYVLKSTLPLFSSFAVWAFAVNFSWKFFHQCEITFWKGHLPSECACFRLTCGGACGKVTPSNKLTVKLEPASQFNSTV